MYAVLRAVKYMYYYGTLLRIQISTATEMLKKKKKELQAKMKLVKDARSVGLTDTSTECSLSFWRWPMTLMFLCRKMPVNAFCISPMILGRNLFAFKCFS